MNDYYIGCFMAKRHLNPCKIWTIKYNIIKQAEKIYILINWNRINIAYVWESLWFGDQEKVSWYEICE